MFFAIFSGKLISNNQRYKFKGATTMAKLSPNYNREPTCIVKMLDSEKIAIRFEQIGSRERFRRLLQRFRDDFLLANCQEREGQPWWIVYGDPT